MQKTTSRFFFHFAISDEGKDEKVAEKWVQIELFQAEIELFYMSFKAQSASLSEQNGELHWHIDSSWQRAQSFRSAKTQRLFTTLWVWTERGKPSRGHFENERKKLHNISQRDPSLVTNWTVNSVLGFISHHSGICTSRLLRGFISSKVSRWVSTLFTPHESQQHEHAWALWPRERLTRRVPVKSHILFWFRRC